MANCSEYSEYEFFHWLLDTKVCFISRSCAAFAPLLIDEIKVLVLSWAPFYRTNYLLSIVSQSRSPHSIRGSLVCLVSMLECYRGMARFHDQMIQASGNNDCYPVFAYSG